MFRVMNRMAQRKQQNGTGKGTDCDRERNSMGQDRNMIREKGFISEHNGTGKELNGTGKVTVWDRESNSMG